MTIIKSDGSDANSNRRGGTSGKDNGRLEISFNVAKVTLTVVRSFIFRLHFNFENSRIELQIIHQFNDDEGNCVFRENCKKKL